MTGDSSIIQDYSGLFRFTRVERGRRPEAFGEREPSRSPGGASRAALPAEDVSGGTPDTARGTHALPGTRIDSEPKMNLNLGRSEHHVAAG